MTRTIACLLPPAPHGSFVCRRPFLEVCGPTALSEVNSDQHRVCLTRLRCAPRLSQPLDALFRSQPVWPCFMPVTLLGFVSQRFPLPDSGARLTPSPCGDGFTTHASPRVISPAGSYPKIRASSTDRDFRGLRTRRVRSPWAGVTRWPQAVPLSDLPLRGLFPSTLAPCFHGASSHGLRHSARRLPACLRACSTECQ